MALPVIRAAIAVASYLAAAVAGAAAMAWWLTRWHDDRVASSGIAECDLVDEPGGGWER